MKTTQAWFDTEIEPEAMAQPGFRALERGETELAGLRGIRWTWHRRPDSAPATTVHERIAAYERTWYRIRIEASTLEFERSRHAIEQWIRSLEIAPPY